MMSGPRMGQDELETQLARFGAKLSAHEVHALYLGALTSTSTGIGPQRLLQTIFGDQAMFGQSLDDANESIGVLIAYWNALVTESQARRVRFAGGGPSLANGAQREDLQRFAERRASELLWYVRGIDAGGDNPTDWGEAGCTVLRKLAEASTFFERYAGFLGDPQAVDTPRLDEARRLLRETSTICERLMADLMLMTERIRLQELQASGAVAGTPIQGVATGVRSSPRVGRNGRCPCGSGKKWKHCCGSPSRLN